MKPTPVFLVALITASFFCLSCATGRFVVIGYANGTRTIDLSVTGPALINILPTDAPEFLKVDEDQGFPLRSQIEYVTYDTRKCLSGAAVRVELLYANRVLVRNQGRLHTVYDRGHDKTGLGAWVFLDPRLRPTTHLVANVLQWVIVKEEAGSHFGVPSCMEHAE